MKIKNFIICLIILLVSNLDVELEEYSKLKNNSNISIKKEDLPCEFSDKAHETVVDFIQKPEIWIMNREFSLITLPVKFLSVQKEQQIM